MIDIKICRSVFNFNTFHRTVRVHMTKIYRFKNLKNQNGVGGWWWLVNEYLNSGGFQKRRRGWKIFLIPGEGSIERGPDVILEGVDTSLEAMTI